MGLVLIQSFGPSSNGIIVSMIRSVGAESVGRRSAYWGIEKSRENVFQLKPSLDPHLALIGLVYITECHLLLNLQPIDVHLSSE